MSTTVIRQFGDKNELGIDDNIHRDVRRNSRIEYDFNVDFDSETNALLDISPAHRLRAYDTDLPQKVWKIKKEIVYLENQIERLKRHDIHFDSSTLSMYEDMLMCRVCSLNNMDVPHY